MLWLCAQNGVFCVGRCTVQWETLCIDVRGLILSKLSLRDLARAGGTCRDFEEAYFGRVAEERARLIALGKEAYGEGMFCGIVTTVQRAMCGLDPCPGVELDLRKGTGGCINAAGETLVRRRSTEGALEGPGSEVWRCHTAPHILVADVGIYLPPVYVAKRGYFNGARVSELRLELSSARRRGLHWQVSLGKQAPAPAIGLLLAICTENQEVLTPCFQRPGSMKLAIWGLISGPASTRKRQAEEVTGPLGLLAQLLAIHPPSHALVTPLGEPVQARTRCVLDSVKASWG